MESRTFQLLEFPKVLARLAEYAVSAPGRAACLAARPFSDPETLRDAQLTLAEACAMRGQTGCSISEFHDMDGVFAHVDNELRTLDLDGLWAVLDLLEKERVLRETLVTPAPGGREEEDAWPRLAAMARAVSRPTRTHAGLRRCLSQDGALRDESSPELFSVRQEIRSIHRKCARQVKDFVKEHGLGPYLQEEYMTISSDRYVLPLRANFKGRVKGVVHDYSQTGETCYVEPFFLVEVNNRLQELKNEERAEEAKVLAFLTGLVRGEREALQGVYVLMTELDALLAKASFAADLGGRLVEVAEGAPVRLAGARHPLLMPRPGTIEQKSRRAADAAVAQDLVLKDDQKALIISGANAGGKTVALKTLGLVSLMTLSGLPVPVEEGGCLPFWREIFVFLGDEQSLEDHLSTFTAQINHLSRAWPRIDEKALVLLDEFGAGTDPAQGAALAQAVVDGLLDKGAWMAAATHFPALKAYGLSKPGVRAACMLFEPSSKKPLYRLAYDQVGASIALDVAREHGLPEEVLSRANKYLLMDGPDAGRVFDRLNELAVSRERELDVLRADRLREAEKAARLRERTEKRLQALEQDVQAVSRRIVKEWEEGRLGRKQAQKALAEERKRLIDEQAREASGETGDADQAAVDFQAAVPGDLLYLPGWKKNGRLADKDARRSMFQVDLGGVKVWVAAKDARPAKPVGARTGGPRLASGEAAGTGSAGEAASSGFSLDLRGFRADEAVVELEAFLDASVLRGLKNLEIVHGKGTGALRREVRESLRLSPLVESFSLAPEDQGGDGMTMVVLK